MSFTNPTSRSFGTRWLSARSARFGKEGRWHGREFDQPEPQRPATATPAARRGHAAARGLTRRVEALRIAFGVIWAIDAYYKWQPDFIKSYADTIASAGKGQPDSLRPWFHFWRHLVVQSPSFFAYATAVVETLIALGLLLGLGRRTLYVGGALWSLAVWTIPEGFGGSLVAGATDIGTAIVYALIFVVLYSLETLPAATAAFTVDRRIEQKIRWWHLVAEPGTGRASRRADGDTRGATPGSSSAARPSRSATAARSRIGGVG